MRIVRRFVLASLLAAALSACGMQQVQESIDDAKAAVSVFHADLDTANIDSIWAETAPMFRSTTDRKQLDALLLAVNRKLGKVVGTEQVGWQANTTTQGSFIVLQMQTKFERGPAQETFTFKREGEDLKLAGYNINSTALITN
jgi:hypothetical protein